MLVTNYSKVPHRYQEPGAGGEKYTWEPGESKEVPDGVGMLMLQAHPQKFIEQLPVLSEEEEAEKVASDAEYLTEQVHSEATTMMTRHRGGRGVRK